MEQEQPPEAGASTEESAPTEASPEASAAIETAPEVSESTTTQAPTTEPPAAEPPAADADKPPAPARPRKPRNPALMRAYRTGNSVDGKVEAVIKGGYEVRVGQVRGFCPHSQIALLREDEPERHVGNTYPFRITQVRRGGEDIVLSRRAVLEHDRLEESKAVRATMVEGRIVQGHVAGTAAFGAFVDLGAGVMGLVHISELAHRRVRTVEDAVSVGDTVQVKILKIDGERGKISLSLKQAHEDPWANVTETFAIGGVYRGTVQRVADFGAFVELAPGLEALAPASEFPPLESGWRSVLEAGHEADWYVMSLDRRARRISVTPPGEGAVDGELTVGLEATGQVQRIERYGVFVWLGPGKVGLMPRAWTGQSEGADLEKSYRVGAAVEVSVVEIEDGGRRIRLAAKGVDARAVPVRDERPRQAARAPRTEKPAQPEETFGTSLADKLRAALDRGSSE